MMSTPSAPSDTTVQLRRALTSLQDMRRRLEATERDRHEPIAIIGMGCRLPGAANPDAFWDLLRNGVDAVTETPLDRWSVARLYDPDPRAPGRVATRWGGFLADIDQFDAAFFGISPREAAQMDPQQRLLLEVAWEALEDGGQAISALAGSLTGVFVGVHSHSSDYYAMQAADPTVLDNYSGTGTSHSVLGGRLSYLLDLHGPSLAIDTACSSSLVAVHLAVQSLRRGECSMAIAAGVNSILDPAFTMVASRMQMMSATGRCRPFDSAADGFVRAEGCGAVVLKRLSDAIEGRDRIIAVINGTAVNQDGRSNGLTAPNSASQKDVIRSALADAGVSAHQVGYIETHGTGTPLGDPIEIEALSEVFGTTDSTTGQTCALGSAKANIGHTEGAAGVVGLIKAVLTLRAGQVPPLVHFQQLNSHISLTGTPLMVPTSLMPWPYSQEPRFAGVSSFGWSGTNAHVIVGEAPSDIPSQDSAVQAHHSDVALLLPISARSPEARHDLAVAYRRLLASLEVGASPHRGSPQVSVTDVCATAALRRSHHPYRLAVTGRGADALVEQLDAFLDGQQDRGLSVGGGEVRPRDLLVFVYPGQGSQWPGMANRLLADDAVFRSAMQRCQQAMAPHVDWSLIDVLLDAGGVEPEASPLERIDVIQPVLFAIQVALTSVWESRGVRPDAVVGHSMGEVAAAHVAGILSLEDAARIICGRSRLLRRISGQGAMAVVELDVNQAAHAIVGFEDRLAVAVSNSPTSTVLSGEPGALDTVMARLDAEGIFCRRIKVDVASHSPQVDVLHDDLMAVLGTVPAKRASIAFFSTVSARFEDGPALDADYWARNLRQPVLFSESVQQLIATDHVRFVELSPHPVLLPAVSESLECSGRAGVTVASMRRDADEPLAFDGALAALYCDGYDIEWRRRYGGAHAAPYRVADLPMYPWQRERHWLERSTATAADRADLATLHQKSGVDNAPDWVYGIQWQRHTDIRPPRPVAGMTWLIFADRHGHGEALASELRATGARCFIVTRSIPQSSAGPDRFDVGSNPSQPLRDVLGLEVLGPLIADGMAPDNVEVVFLWGLDAQLDPRDTGVGVERSLQSGCGSLVEVAVALSRSGFDSSPMWVATKGVHRVPLDADAEPSEGIVSALIQSPLWGFGRAVAEELPDMWGGLIDLDPSESTAQSGRSLAVELTCASVEAGTEEVVLRGGSRWVAHLVPTTPAPAKTLGIPSDSTCLVTGGFGAVGRHLLAWLAAKGARRIVVLGRTALPARRQWSALDIDTPTGRRVAQIQQLERLGVDVHVAAVDVGDADALHAFLEEFRAEGWPPIRSVFHAAAVLGAETIDDLDAASLAEQLLPKVVGAWTLSEALDDLDHFVMFSSLASILPSTGQSAYAAANAFLDALAHHRRAQGRCGLSVNWAYWENTNETRPGEVGQGRAADGPGYKDSAKVLLEAQGVFGFRPDDGLEVLGRLMLGSHVQAVVAPIDWVEFGAAHRARPLSLVADRVADAVRRSPEPAASESPPLRTQLSASPPHERYELIESVVRRVLSRVLKLPESRIDRAQPFGALGLDSLMSMELRNRLEAELGLKMPATVAWNYPTVKDMGGYVLSRLALSPLASDPLIGRAGVSGLTTEADIWVATDSVTSLTEDEALSALMSGTTS